MNFNDGTKFYYGTSTSYNFTTTIAPYTKITSASKTLYKRKTEKVRITIDPDTALYYADKSVSIVGGYPVIYEVNPNRYTMVKTSKNGFYTSNADIIRIVPLDEILHDYLLSKIDFSDCDADFTGSIVSEFSNMVLNKGISREDAVNNIREAYFNNDIE